MQPTNGAKWPEEKDGLAPPTNVDHPVMQQLFAPEKDGLVGMMGKRVLALTDAP